MPDISLELSYFITVVTLFAALGIGYLIGRMHQYLLYWEHYNSGHANDAECKCGPAVSEIHEHEQ